MILLRTACLIVIVSLCCSCAPMLQRDVDEQGKAILVLQQKTQELERSLRRLQADYQNETDRLNIELEALKTRIEESNRRNERILADLSAKSTKEGASSEPEQEPTQTSGVPQIDKQVTSTPQTTETVLTEKDLYNQAYAAYTSGEYAKARKQFQEFLQRYPSSTKSDSALYWIAQCYFKEKKFEDAIAACDDVIKKFPKGSKTADAYYLQALAFCEIQDPLTAQILLETLMQNFPDTEAAKLGKKKYDELKTHNQ